RPPLIMLKRSFRHYNSRMSLRTTCIGAYPKPDYIRNVNWGETRSVSAREAKTREFTYTLTHPDWVSDEACDRATREAVVDQVNCGVNIPTDGEQRRENYIHYHCRHLEGIDFDQLTRKVHRYGAAVAYLPTIIGTVVPKGHNFLNRDFSIAQSCTDNPIKLTVPGPLTIIDTTANSYYEDDRTLAFDLADAINFEIRALADAGCKYIQVDEPLFARNVSRALEFGVECLERCFDGLPHDVERVMHMCCGYPGYLDDEAYEKADPDCYASLAKALDDSSVDSISIEDAHRHNDLGLLERFSKSTVILGSVAIATSRVETVEEISNRIAAALNHIDRTRLVAAPDCGLAMLDRRLAMKKLRNMCEAARSV
ncbi:MAG: cobalamin-independent methionine synthase II family protein, partial [Woeseia sp.]